MHSTISRGQDSACHALRWWSGDQLARVASAMQKVLAAWEQDWGLPQVRQGEQPVRCAMASEWSGAGAAASLRWQPVPLQGGLKPATELWWAVSAVRQPSQLMDVLLPAMFGAASDAVNPAGAVSGLAAETATAAWTDLWRRVGESLPVREPADAASTGEPSSPDATSQPAPHSFQPWSGAVVLTLAWCGQELQVLAGGSVVESFLRALHAITARPAITPGAVVPVWDAVSGVAATVRAELEPVELSVGAVRGLRVGDVIELSHSLDRPLLARTDNGELLCEAFLGKNGDHRAIELLRAPARPF